MMVLRIPCFRCGWKQTFRGNQKKTSEQLANAEHAQHRAHAILSFFLDAKAASANTLLDLCVAHLQDNSMQQLNIRYRS
jgi:cellobiose-specific phosphotransferase system component IIA